MTGVQGRQLRSGREVVDVALITGERRSMERRTDQPERTTTKRRFRRTVWQMRRGLEEVTSVRAGWRLALLEDRQQGEPTWGRTSSLPAATCSSRWRGRRPA